MSEKKLVQMWNTISEEIKVETALHNHLIANTTEGLKKYRTEETKIFTALDLSSHGFCLPCAVPSCQPASELSTRQLPSPG